MINHVGKVNMTVAVEDLNVRKIWFDLQKLQVLNGNIVGSAEIVLKGREICYWDINKIKVINEAYLIFLA